MAGEQRLATLYADVHYYFSEPTPRPSHHRFDKSSYVYLYRDSAARKGRLEIANHAGKPEQDAFTGYLDNTMIAQSQKHPTLVTVIVDGFRDPATSPQASGSDAQYWRLPSTDPRDEGTYLFRLHTIDIYFWTLQDAQTFVDAARKTLKQEQLSVETPPPAPHTEVMSPVVQQLENIAITDPAYHNGQTRNSRTASVATPSALSAQETKTEMSSFTPLTYNPAAPPAPEVIKHREKTPPPPDAATGTGLAAATYHDQAHAFGAQALSAYGSPNTGPMLSPQAYTGSHQGYTSTPYTSPPLSSAYAQSPPASSQANRGSSISSLPPPPPKSAGNKTNPYIPPSAATSPQFAPPPTKPRVDHYTPGTTPMETPTTQILGDSYIAGPQQPLAHLQPHYADYFASPPQQPEAPVGGYADYKYEQPSRHHSHSHEHDPGSIHSQVYRPTEEELVAHNRRHKPSFTSGSGQKPGKLEAKAQKVEGGVNRFLKKLENKLG